MAEARISVKVEGIRDTVRVFHRIKNGAFEVVRREVATSAINVQAESKRILETKKPKKGPRYRRGKRTDSPYAEVDTGRLVNSIQIEFAVLGLRADVGTPIPYGKYIEFGTTRMIARPYLRTAWEHEAPRFGRATIRAVKRTAERGR